MDAILTRVRCSQGFVSSGARGVRTRVISNKFQKAAPSQTVRNESEGFEIVWKKEKNIQMFQIHRSVCVHTVIG